MEDKLSKKDVELPAVHSKILKNLYKDKSKKITTQPSKATSKGIPIGARNNALFSLAGKLRRDGHDLEAIIEVLAKVKCEGPLPVEEIEKIAESAMRYPNGREEGSSAAINFIYSWISERGLSYSLSDIPKLMGKDKSLEYIKSLIFLEAKKGRVSGVSRDLLKHFFSVWENEEREKALTNLKNHIAFTKKNELVEEFVQAVTGISDNTDIAVMKHWIANCKRKLNGKIVKDHIMPILYGKTGSGKSVAIHKLTEPLSDLTMEAALSFVNEPRNDFNYVKKLIIIFDELSRASKTDKSSLKQKITSPYIESRLLGTSSNYRGVNMSNFIGASNQEVKDVIHDPTSSRRYYQIKTLDKIDWDKINSIDYLELWRGVNESISIDYLSKARLVLKARQEEIRAMDSVEEWLEEDKLKPIDEALSEYYSYKRIYRAYKYWMESQNKGSYMFGKNMFGRKMTEYIGPSIVKNGERVYKLSHNFDITYKNITDGEEDLS